MNKTQNLTLVIDEEKEKKRKIILFFSLTFAFYVY